MVSAGSRADSRRGIKVMETLRESTKQLEAKGKETKHALEKVRGDWRSVALKGQEY